MLSKKTQLLNELNHLKIVIVTRSCNKSLFISSGKTIQLPFKRKRLRYTTAEGYLYKILKINADIVINIDEDAFVLESTLILQLIAYMIENKYANCGLPDGGVLPIRNHNPLVTNPFFNIFDLRKLRKGFNLQKIKKYKSLDPTLINNTPFHLMKTEFKYDLYEPFYPFFLWLNQNYKVLYLDGLQHQDGITTILKDHLGNNLLLHSWYSRFYNSDTFHTNRIDSLIQECGIKINYETNSIVETFLNKHYMPIKMLVRRVLKKLTFVYYI